ncbi:MAG: hypothetical protein IJK72_01720 [Mycoplasma sp.]|nr:hypothetical protein [Mycoplasma sp.]
MNRFDELLKDFPGNESISFIVKRFKQINYRGMAVSNHNRQMHFEHIWSILKKIYKYVQNGMMSIRHTDIKKNPSDAEWPLYGKLVADIYIETKRSKGGDSLRKQLFVDMARIGFLERYDKVKQKEILKPGFDQDKFRTWFVKIPDWVCTHIKNNTKKSLNRFYLNELNTLTNNVLSDLIYSHDNNYNSFSLHEVAFFLTAYKTNFGFGSINLKKIYDLIAKWRAINFVQQKLFIGKLKQTCEKINLTAKNKTGKRDYNNFINHARQLMFILTQTPYYQYSDKKRNKILWMKTSLATGGKSTKRDLYEKNQYYSFHSIEKSSKDIVGYELHHIIPLHVAIDINDRKLLDNHLNMILIDSKQHSIIHKTRDSNNSKCCYYKVKTNNLNKSIILSDLMSHPDVAAEIEFINRQNAFFDFNKSDEIQKYNDCLIKGT